MAMQSGYFIFTNDKRHTCSRSAMTREGKIIMCLPLITSMRDLIECICHEDFHNLMDKLEIGTDEKQDHVMMQRIGFE